MDSIIPSYNLDPGVTPGQLDYKRKMAYALMREGANAEPIRAWTQGAARVAQALMGGLAVSNADTEEKTQREQAIADMMASLNGGGQPSPVAAALGSQPPQTMPARPPGLAPQSSGVPARDISLDDPSMRPPQSAMAAALNGPNARPTTGIPGPAPAPAQPSPVASALAGPLPQMPPQPPQQQPMPQESVDPRLMKAMMNPFLPPQGAAIGGQILAKQLGGQKLEYQKLDNGDILAMDPTGRQQPRVVYNAPKNPALVSLDEEKQHFNRDPVTGKMTPIELPNQGQRGVSLPNGETLTPPPGVDYKQWKKTTAEDVANAQAGKMTEVQAKDLKFASRMENSEKLLSGKNLDHEPITWSGPLKRMSEGSDWVPWSRTVGNIAMPESYQRYRTARDQFLSGVLRDESGAAVNTSEWQRYERDFFPQPGDTKQIIADKRQARSIAIDAMKKGIGLPATFMNAKDLAAKVAGGGAAPQAPAANSGLPPPPDGFVVQ